MVSFDGKYMTSYLIAIVLFSLFYEIFANQIKCPRIDLENEGQGQGGENLDLCYSIGNVPFHIGDFFSEF